MHYIFHITKKYRKKYSYLYRHTVNSEIVVSFCMLTIRLGKYGNDKNSNSQLKSQQLMSHFLSILIISFEYAVNIIQNENWKNLYKVFYSCSTYTWIYTSCMKYVCLVENPCLVISYKRAIQTRTLFISIQFLKKNKPTDNRH